MTRNWGVAIGSPHHLTGQVASIAAGMESGAARPTGEGDRGRDSNPNLRLPGLDKRSRAVNPLKWRQPGAPGGLAAGDPKAVGHLLDEARDGRQGGVGTLEVDGAAP